MTGLFPLENTKEIYLVERRPPRPRWLGPLYPTTKMVPRRRTSRTSPRVIGDRLDPNARQLRIPPRLLGSINNRDPIHPRQRRRQRQHQQPSATPRVLTPRQPNQRAKQHLFPHPRRRGRVCRPPPSTDPATGTEWGLERGG